MDKKRLLQAASLIVAMIAMICVIIPAATGTLQFLIVLSGSMSPIMQPGDMVVVKTITPEDVRVGDIIAYHDPGGAENVIVTHRAMQIEEEDGIINIQTKGDANEDADSYTVTSDDVIGEMVFVLPYLGYAVERSKKPLTFIVLVVLPSLLIIADELRKIAMCSNPVLARKTDRDERKNKKRRTPTVINYTRLSTIMLAGLCITVALFIPYLTGCGYAEVSRTERIENFESLPSVFVFNPANRADSAVLPNHVVLPGKSADEVSIPVSASAGSGSAGSRTKMAVSESPYIMPVFWIVALAGVNPYLPCVVSILLPPILITLILSPLWVRKRFKHRRPILKQLRRMPVLVGLSSSTSSPSGEWA